MQNQVRIAGRIYGWHKHIKFPVSFAFHKSKNTRADDCVLFASLGSLGCQCLSPWEPVLHSWVISWVEINCHTFISFVLLREFTIEAGSLGNIIQQKLLQLMVEFMATWYFECTANWPHHRQDKLVEQIRHLFCWENPLSRSFHWMISGDRWSLSDYLFL